MTAAAVRNEHCTCAQISLEADVYDLDITEAPLVESLDLSELLCFLAHSRHFASCEFAFFFKGSLNVAASLSIRLENHFVQFITFYYPIADSSLLPHIILLSAFANPCDGAKIHQTIIKMIQAGSVKMRAQGGEIVIFVKPRQSNPSKPK